MERETRGRGESHALASSPGGAIFLPYAFPKPGAYRIWVQVKRDGRILTGVFDARVAPAR